MDVPQLSHPEYSTPNPLTPPDRHPHGQPHHRVPYSPPLPAAREHADDVSILRARLEADERITHASRPSRRHTTASVMREQPRVASHHRDASRARGSRERGDAARRTLHRSNAPVSMTQLAQKADRRRRHDARVRALHRLDMQLNLVYSRVANDHSLADLIPVLAPRQCLTLLQAFSYMRQQQDTQEMSDRLTEKQTYRILRHHYRAEHRLADKVTDMRHLSIDSAPQRSFVNHPTDDPDDQHDDTATYDPVNTDRAMANIEDDTARMRMQRLDVVEHELTNMANAYRGADQPLYTNEFSRAEQVDTLLGRCAAMRNEYEADDMSCGRHALLRAMPKHADANELPDPEHWEDHEANPKHFADRFSDVESRDDEPRSPYSHRLTPPKEQQSHATRRKGGDVREFGDVSYVEEVFYDTPENIEPVSRPHRDTPSPGGTHNRRGERAHGREEREPVRRTHSSAEWESPPERAYPDNMRVSRQRSSRSRKPLVDQRVYDMSPSSSYASRTRYSRASHAPRYHTAAYRPEYARTSQGRRRRSSRTSRVRETHRMGSPADIGYATMPGLYQGSPASRIDVTFHETDRRMRPRPSHFEQSMTYLPSRPERLQSYPSGYDMPPYGGSSRPPPPPPPPPYHLEYPYPPPPAYDPENYPPGPYMSGQRPMPYPHMQTGYGGPGYPPYPGAMPHSEGPHYAGPPKESRVDKLRYGAGMHSVMHGIKAGMQKKGNTPGKGNEKKGDSNLLGSATEALAFAGSDPVKFVKSMMTGDVKDQVMKKAHKIEDLWKEKKGTSGGVTNVISKTMKDSGSSSKGNMIGQVGHALVKAAKVPGVDMLDASTGKDMIKMVMKTIK